MPYKLDEIDTAILESLFKDGRKSFRQISREIKVSTPTVKTRYQRLVDTGLVKGVFPTIDMDKIGKKYSETNNSREHKLKLGNNILVKLSCDYCQGPVTGKPTTFKFANFERFFCCRSCRTLYREKYRGKISSISSRHKT